MGDWPTDEEDWEALIEKEAALLENYWTRYDNVALIALSSRVAIRSKQNSCARGVAFK